MDIDWSNCYSCNTACHRNDMLSVAGYHYHTECAPDISLPKLSMKELEDARRDPYEWAKMYMKKIKAEQPIKYHLTFTWNNSVEKSKWKKRVHFELKRKYVKEILSLCLEHEETNIHVHAYVVTSQNLRKRDFSTFEKGYGFIKSQLVKQDNGIAEYAEKENKIVLEDLV